jgi:cytochrome d ubiquinol oxidase subunit I
MGVVTGIPLEFQFGTNWARFSNFAGELIGQTLAMEGLFAFFLESAFLGLFLYAEKRLGPRGHLATAIALFLGSWLSGYFIIVTNAFMQHPVGYTIGTDGVLHLADFWVYLFNPWAFWQYAHTMLASVVTASFVVCALGAYWSLLGIHADHAKVCLRVGSIAGLVSSLLVAFPAGDGQGKLLAKHQPAALAAMEGLFEGGPYSELALIGQPNVAQRRLENPIVVPGVLSFLAYGTFGSTVKGLNDFPLDEWPQNVELLYYCYHIMVGLGTLFILVMGASVLLLPRDRLTRTRPVLWVLMLAFPFPYLATTAGWWTAELGRQPWIVHGLMRTAQAGSALVNPGDVVFTTLGFAGLYMLLGVLFILQVLKEVAHGPVPHA